MKYRLVEIKEQAGFQMIGADIIFSKHVAREGEWRSGIGTALGQALLLYTLAIKTLRLRSRDNNLLILGNLQPAV